jgi:hypothetical protein
VDSTFRALMAAHGPLNIEDLDTDPRDRLPGSPRRPTDPAGRRAFLRPRLPPDPLSHRPPLGLYRRRCHGLRRAGAGQEPLLGGPNPRGALVPLPDGAGPLCPRPGSGGARPAGEVGGPEVAPCVRLPGEARSSRARRQPGRLPLRDHAAAGGRGGPSLSWRLLPRRSSPTLRQGEPQAHLLPHLPRAPGRWPAPSSSGRTASWPRFATPTPSRCSGKLLRFNAGNSGSSLRLATTAAPRRVTPIRCSAVAAGPAERWRLPPSDRGQDRALQLDRRR